MSSDQSFEKESIPQEVLDDLPLIESLGDPSSSEETDAEDVILEEYGYHPDSLIEVTAITDYEEIALVQKIHKGGYIYGEHAGHENALKLPRPYIYRPRWSPPPPTALVTPMQKPVRGFVRDIPEEGRFERPRGIRPKEGSIAAEAVTARFLVDSRGIVKDLSKKPLWTKIKSYLKRKL